MARLTGAITPIETPRTGHEVICPTRGRGRVIRTAKSGTLWVKFPDAHEPVMYTLRRSIGEYQWRAFPGAASAPSLRF